MKSLTDWVSKTILGAELGAARTTPAMTNDKEPPFAFPSVSGKKVAATFDGGRLTSNSGVLLLALIEKQMKIAARLAALIPDRREAV